MSERNSHAAQDDDHDSGGNEQHSQIDQQPSHIPNYRSIPGRMKNNGSPHELRLPFNAISSSGEEFAMRLIGRSREIILRYLLAVCLAFLASHAYGQRPVTFPLQRGPGEIQADLYGSGTRAVILAHGG